MVWDTGSSSWSGERTQHLQPRCSLAGGEQAIMIRNIQNESGLAIVWLSCKPGRHTFGRVRFAIDRPVEGSDVGARRRPAINLWVLDERLVYHHYLAFDFSFRRMTGVVNAPSSDWIGTVVSVIGGLAIAALLRFLF